MKRLILLVFFMALFSSFVAAENETIGIQKVMSAGDTVTLNVSGAQAVVNLVGVNNDAKTAMITINGESKQLHVGQTDTLGGIRIYLRQVFEYPVVMKSGAELFIGSNLTSAEDIQPIFIPATPAEPKVQPKYPPHETFILTAGDSKTITDPFGNSFVINIVGVNSDSGTAMITAQGESRQISVGEVFTKEPFNIYLKKIYSCAVCAKQPSVELDVIDTETDNKNKIDKVLSSGDTFNHELHNGSDFNLKVAGIDATKGLLGVEINNIAYSLKEKRFIDVGDVRIYVNVLYEYHTINKVAEIFIYDNTPSYSGTTSDAQPTESKPNIHFNFARNQTSAVYLQNESRYLDSFYLGLNEEKEIIINKTPRKLKLTFFDPATGHSVVKIDGNEYIVQSGRIIEFENSLVSLDKVYVSPQGTHLAYFRVVSTLAVPLYQKTEINATKLSCIVSQVYVAEGDNENLTHNGKQYFFKVDKTDTGQGLADITIEKEKVRFYVGQKIYYKDFEVEFADMYLWLSKIPVAVFNVTTCEPVYEEDALRQEISQNKTDAPVLNDSSNIVIEQAPKQEKSFWQKIMDFFANIF